MSESKCQRYLVLSDMHFGTEETSANDPIVLRMLKCYLQANGPWAEVIFSGDLLDLNLSTMTKSIEGYSQKGIMGFREFIDKLNTPPLPVGNWIYIPGNHDYFIWDLLSNQRVCCNVLACGKPMGTIATPHKADKWVGRESFISGVFPAGQINDVIVEYPDHEVNCSGKKLVITHGHYLDAAQTQLKSVFNLLGQPKNTQKAVRDMFIETAQYQAVAHAVSYTSKSRNLIGFLLGPDNWWSKAKRVFGIFARDAFESPLRNKPIDKWQRRAIEFFLMHYRLYPTAPYAFIFGHTHCPGKDSTSRIPIKKRLFQSNDIAVYNAGSFLPKQDVLASFLLIEPGPNFPNISVHCINRNGTITQLL